jgi:hypothetical protein
MMASAILRHGGSKREVEKREETPSSLSSLRGASLASCVASRDNLGETSPACSMVFFFMFVVLITSLLEKQFIRTSVIYFLYRLISVADTINKK